MHSRLRSLVWLFIILASNSLLASSAFAGSSQIPQVDGSPLHAAEAADACVENPSTLCLLGGRFSIEVEWTDFENNTGYGRVVPVGTPFSGLFWFFSENNWEVLVKVIDGCDLNNHLWVFAASTTNVGYRLRVTDHEADIYREYTNTLGESAPAINDNRAFPTCQPPADELLIFASPSNLATLRQSTITVIARDSEGQALGAGERIRLVPDLGFIEPEVVFTDSRGEAQAIFTAGEQSGSGSVTAITDNGKQASVSLEIRDAASVIVLSANPTFLDLDFEGTIEFHAFVLNARAEPVPDQLVVFVSAVGEFEGGASILTDDSGRAERKLIVQPDDLNDVDQFEVLVFTDSEGERISDSVILTVIQ